MKNDCNIFIRFFDDYDEMITMLVIEMFGLWFMLSVLKKIATLRICPYFNIAFK